MTNDRRAQRCDAALLALGAALRRVLLVPGRLRIDMAVARMSDTTAVSPELGKAPPDRRDNRPMTWPMFLALRAWAKRVAEAEHATVCIVGSALYRFPPRDVDVSIILPRAEFETRFGPLPDTSEPDAYRELWAATEKAKAEAMHDMNAQEAVEWAVRVDVKFAPDCWWPDGERLVLADGRLP